MDKTSDAEVWNVSRLLNELTDPYGDNADDAEIMRRAADYIEHSAARCAKLETALNSMLTFYGMDEERGEVSGVIHDKARAALAGEGAT